MKSLELLEARQEITRLREELKYYHNLAARQKRYIDGQMKPLVSMGIKQGAKIKTLEKKLRQQEATNISNIRRYVRANGIRQADGTIQVPART